MDSSLSDFAIHFDAQGILWYIDIINKSFRLAGEREACPNSSRVSLPGIANDRHHKRTNECEERREERG